MAVYPKPYHNNAQLLQKLQGRGMAITDLPAAERCLKRVGYYRLSGYWFPMRQSQALPGVPGSKPTTLVLDQFRPGTNFAQVAELYVFDKRLRLLLLDAIERVEVALKVMIADLLGQRNPLAYLDPQELHGNFSRKTGTGATGHEKWVTRYRRLETQAKDDFIRPFLQKYPNNEFPIWMAIEFWDFGALSFFLSGMKITDRQTLAGTFGLPREDLLVSWVRAMNGVRNTCAHHSRLWNRPLIDNPSPPKVGDHLLLDHLATDPVAQTRVYAVAAALQFLLRTIHPGSGWATRLKQHCATFPAAPNVQLAQAGFPANWEQLALWN
jgi:abortive infection bacteriophage resistance protein